MPILNLLKINKLVVLNRSELVNYYESTIVRGVPIFVDFVGTVNHENLFPTNSEFVIDLNAEGVKTTNSRIHDLVKYP